MTYMSMWGVKYFEYSKIQLVVTDFIFWEMQRYEAKPKEFLCAFVAFYFQVPLSKKWVLSLTLALQFFYLMFSYWKWQYNAAQFVLILFQDECLVCHSFIYPGEEVSCTIDGCQGVYHLKCAKNELGFSTKRKFKCPQHVKFLPYACTDYLEKKHCG